MMQWRTKRMTRLAFMLALGLLLSYIESLIPFYFGIPGAKLGLSNLMVLLILYTYGMKDALFVNIVRILTAGILFSNFFGILYSIAGALLSFLAMILVKKFTKAGITTVSIAGGIFHNIGQIMVATVLISHFSFLYYLPFLLGTGIVAGFLIGRLADILLKRGIL